MGRLKFIPYEKRFTFQGRKVLFLDFFSLKRVSGREGGGGGWGGRWWWAHTSGYSALSLRCNSLHLLEHAWLSLTLSSAYSPIQTPLQTMQIQMRRLVTSRLIRIYTVCHFCIDFFTETPICNNACVQIQRRKSPFQKLRGERVNRKISHQPQLFITHLGQRK